MLISPSPPNQLLVILFKIYKIFGGVWIVQLFYKDVGGNYYGVGTSKS